MSHQMHHLPGEWCHSCCASQAWAMVTASGQSSVQLVLLAGLHLWARAMRALLGQHQTALLLPAHPVHVCNNTTLQASRTYLTGPLPNHMDCTLLMTAKHTCALLRQKIQPQNGSATDAEWQVLHLAVGRRGAHLCDRTRNKVKF